MFSIRSTARLHGQRELSLGVCFAIAGFLALCCGCQSKSVSTGPEVRSEDYREARSHFHTHLIRHTAAPQEGAALQAPPGAVQVVYSTRDHFEAWISAPSGSRQAGAKQPAVLFLHGGFAIGEDDWDMTKPYRDAGFIVMTPVLRGENGQQGDYSMFYNEVDDVLAAGNYLTGVSGVDAQHIYLAGHSVGGTLTLLAAMSTDRFRAATSFSGSPDQAAFAEGQPELVPFDPNDQREFQMRSPVAFATSFKCPVRLYYGDQESAFGSSSEHTADLARQKHLDARAVSVPGDHFSAVPAEIQLSIEFFRTH